MFMYVKRRGFSSRSVICPACAVKGDQMDGDRNDFNWSFWSTPGQDGPMVEIRLRLLPMSPRAWSGEAGQGWLRTSHQPAAYLANGTGDSGLLFCRQVWTLVGSCWGDQQHPPPPAPQSMKPWTGLNMKREGKHALRRRMSSLHSQLQS